MHLHLIVRLLCVITSHCNTFSLNMLNIRKHSKQNKLSNIMKESYFMH